MGTSDRRIGLLGGSFDPIHNGHLALAREVHHRLSLDRVWLVPAARSPSKTNPTRAPAEARRAMIELAIIKEPELKLCDYELKRAGPSYTVETLKQLHREHPKNEWFWILGLDAFLDFPNWKEPHTILDLAHLVVGVRPGNDWSAAEHVLEQLTASHPPPYEISETENGLRTFTRTNQPGIFFLDMTPWDIASSHIRQAFRADPSVKKMLPPDVVPYMIEHHLYE